MWDENKHFSTHIRAAIDAKLPPKMVMFDDPDHKEYDKWDLKLLKAYHFTLDFEKNSFPVWWDESDRVTFDAKTGISKSQAAIDRKQAADSKNKKEPTPGVYYYAVPRVIDGGSLPTFEEWVAERASKNPPQK